MSVYEQKSALSQEMARLQWQCRRGMLELDLILSRFLSQQYQDLSVTDKEKFQNLLHCTDPELFGWLMQRENCPLPQFRPLIQKIIKSNS